MIFLEDEHGAISTREAGVRDHLGDTEEIPFLIWQNKALILSRIGALNLNVSLLKTFRVMVVLFWEDASSHPPILLF